MANSPKISVCTPIWNRNHFIPLMIKNLKCQNYPHDKLTWVIDDDGDTPLIRDGKEMSRLTQALAPIKIRYHYYKTRRTIGEKRNNIARLCPDPIFCNMDSDDLYSPHYIGYSLKELTTKNAGLCGSKDMIFVYPFHNFSMSAIKCRHLIQIHENTMMMTKKYFNASKGFQKTSRGEGAALIGRSPGNVIHISIQNLVVTVCHGKGNIVNKEMFRNKRIKLSIKAEDKLLLNSILNIA
ncbi:MAG: glycosyltransferase [Desulfobacter sp.]|nr:glycosyltransferase [Desulfobacter sp.]WDP87652.1 MAG: glycosyltransferase [Desulfobacter sp.]